MLLGFNEEEMLEEKVDEVPKKASKVTGELGQGEAAEAEDGRTTTKGGATIEKDDTIAVEGGATAEKGSSNLSPNL